MNVYDEFDWRGVRYDATPDLKDLLATEKITAYIGFDPTASSLHVGTLMPIMGLARLQRAGHSPIALVGGGTGLIGDPSGKTKERQLLSKAQVEENIAGIRSQLEPFLDFEAASNPAKIVNNHDWLGSLALIDFLRDTGKHFTVNYMMAKESVKRRLGSDDGISYTEFTYMLLQAYDFMVLNERYDCVLQAGGSDQWGNILAGAELIRRVHGRKAHGLVYPLVTSASGIKFGKTEAGTIWLDPNRTSPYRFYQFWLNTDDADVINYLKYFTWMDASEIDMLAHEMDAAPHLRSAQRTLGQHVTTMVHGQTAYDRAIQASQVLFGKGDIRSLTLAEITDIFDDVPSVTLPKEDFSGEGKGLLDLLREAGATKSNGEARRLIQGGGVTLNGERLSDPNARITVDNALEGKILVLRKGRKKYHLVKLG